jgi:hypothetical protein
VRRAVPQVATGALISGKNFPVFISERQRDLRHRVGAASAKLRANTVLYASLKAEMMGHTHCYYRARLGGLRHGLNS